MLDANSDQIFPKMETSCFYKDSREIAGGYVQHIRKKFPCNRFAVMFFDIADYPINGWIGNR